jgi:hypothetical protein
LMAKSDWQGKSTFHQTFPQQSMTWDFFMRSM